MSKRAFVERRDREVSTSNRFFPAAQSFFRLGHPNSASGKTLLKETAIATCASAFSR
jgi:hypothetical protein